MIKIFNTLTNKKEEFVPQKDKEVSMYICGITPYDSVHLGHARAYVAFDVIKRHFINRGYKVSHIQNFTDVDDKIIKRANEKHISPSQLAQTFIDDYFVQMDKLNILKANTYPRVTQMMPEIINFIKVLIEKGVAYQVDGDVYFNVDKFSDYGKLSNRKLEDLKAGARVQINDDKHSPADFALWKKSKENEPEDVCWDSPWGKGRPGWHIECSVMSSKLLGDTLDIHGGGQDLIFPHHENEIAQSESKSGKQFVRYWIHNGFVTINKEKMSKSLGNFFTLQDIFKKYDPRIIRYYLMSQHYKTPLDFSDFALEAAKSALQGLDDAYLRLINIADKASEIKDEDLLDLHEKFLSALDDDFNSEKAFSFLHILKNIILNDLFKADKNRLSQLRKLFEILSQDSLGIVLPKAIADDDIATLLENRNAARKAKDWAQADKFRKLIDEKGYKINDNPDGTSTATKKI